MADENHYADKIRIPFTFQVQVPAPQPFGMIGRRRHMHPPAHPGRGVPASQHDAPQAHPAAAIALTAVTYAAPSVTLAEIVTVIAAGIEATIALIALPEFLAAAALTGAVILVIKGVRYSFRDPAAAQRWARQVAEGAMPPESLPVADPIPSLPPMEAGPELPAHTGHPAPTVRLPAFTPPLPPVVLPPVLSGPEPADAQPTIMESRGNGPHSSSRNARASARQQDPAVTGHLDNAQWWAHHLINLAATRSVRYRSLFASAIKYGWRADDPGNIAPLPNSSEAQTELRSTGIARAYHNSGHPTWNGRVQELLEGEDKKLAKQFGDAQSEKRDLAAYLALLRVQRILREDMLRLDRISMLEGDDEYQPT